MPISDSERQAQGSRSDTLRIFLVFENLSVNVADVTETTLSMNRSYYATSSHGENERNLGGSVRGLNTFNPPLDYYQAAPNLPEETSRVTINDVAREAGVSVATVSKVVNGRYGVSPATCTRVMQVVERMGYESSLVASSLRRGSTNVIGILLAGFEPFSTELLKGMSQHALGRDYQLLAYSGAIADDRAVGWERRSISRLAGTLMDGAVIVTPTVALPSTKMPIVAIDPFKDPDGPPFVDTDSYDGAQKAVKHLLDLGHTKIGHIRGRADLESAHDRETGWRFALVEAGIKPQDNWLRDGGYRRDWARHAALEMLQQPDRPTAIFAANDISAFGVLDAAAQLGLKVPEDLSVVGFDDIPEAAMIEPRLTTVAQPLQEMGAMAFDMVLDMIHGRRVDQHVQLPTRLIVRATTAPPNA